MKSLTRLTVLVVVLAGLTLATGVAYAGQLDVHQLAGMFRPAQGTSPEAQDFMDIDLRNMGDGDDDEIEIIGVVTSITTDTLVVSDTVIAITPETEFEDVVAVGDMVKVEAFYADDGTLTASKVELFEEDDDDEYFKIIGVVTAITTDTLTLSDTVIAITPETIFEDEIAVGDMVKVKAFYADDGTLTAYKVELYEKNGNDPNPGFGYETKVKIVGVVESFYSDSIIVSGIPISITEQTKIQGNIEVSDTVMVHAYLAEDGTLTAWKIKELPNAVGNPGHGDKITVIRGVVESIISDTVVVSGIEFAITSETKITGDLSVGDTVKVRAYTAEDGTVIASKITVLSGGSEDGSDDFRRGDDEYRNRGDRSDPGSGDQYQDDGGNGRGGNDKGGDGNHGGGNGKSGDKDKGGGKEKGGGRGK